MYREEWSRGDDDSSAPWTMLCSKHEDWKGFIECLEQYLDTNLPEKGKRASSAYTSLKYLFQDLQPLSEKILVKLAAKEKQQAKQDYIDSLEKRSSERVLMKELQKQEEERKQEILRREREIEEMKRREERKKLDEERKIQQRIIVRY